MASLTNRLWTLATYLKVLRGVRLPAWRRYGQRYLHELTHRRVKPNAYCRHLVILAWEFPPAVTGGVYRPASFARYASEQGWEVTVVCGPLPTNPSNAGAYLAEVIPRNVSVHSVPATPPGPHPSPLPRVDGGIGNALNVYEAASDILSDIDPGIILASGPPFHNFIAATWLAKRFGWKLVLDYRDEWSHNPFQFVMNDQTNARQEASCLKCADHVIFTTHSQLANQATSFPALDKKTGSVVFNGWEPRDFSNKTPTVDLQPLQRKPFTLAFFGNLGPMAHPGEFLNTLSKVYDDNPALIAATQVVFVGYKQEAVLKQLADFPYQDNLLLLDQVSKAEAAVLMRNVNALLLLNTPALFRYIQGKLYDYMASDTPILFYGKGGEMATVIEEQQAGLVIPYSDTVALTRALNSLIDEEVQPAPSKQQWLQNRTREHQAMTLLSTLDQLIQADRSSGQAK